MMRQKNIRFYLNGAACLLALSVAVVYAVYTAGNKTFVPAVFITLLLGVAAGAAGLFVRLSLLPIVPCVCWSLAFGLFFQNRLMMFGDYLNGLPGLSGGGNIIELVIALLVCIALCVTAEIVVCFLPAQRLK